MLGSLSRGGSVLCFHSITGPNWPSASATHTPIETFVSVLEVARSVCDFVPLGELLERHQRGRNSGGLCAITFDDAYASLLGPAADLLRDFSVPATVFVAADMARVGGAYWWDRLDDLMPWVGAARWRQFEDACGLPDAFRQGQSAEYGPLRPLRQWILSHFRGRWPDELKGALAALEQEAGFRTAQRSMTFAELRAFRAHTGVEVGLHTRSHAVLALLPDAEVSEEIGACHEILRRELGEVQPFLAIPYGLFDARTPRLARESGVRASFTVARAILRPGTPPELLPRICIGRREASWKLRLRLLGVVDVVRERRGERPALEYPPIPSVTT